MLRTERLVLTAATLDDVDAITASCQDELMRDTLASLPWPYTRDDAEFFVREIVAAGWASGDSPVWGIRDAGSATSDSGWTPPPAAAGT